MHKGGEEFEKDAVGGVEENPKKRVLLVDDVEPIRRALERMIKGMVKGAEFTSVPSVDEAIQKISEGLHPDIILSDMMMPGKTGKEFYDWLKKERPEMIDRFFLVSGGSGDPSLQAFIKDFGKRSVEKPFREKDIRELIRLVFTSGVEAKEGD